MICINYINTCCTHSSLVMKSRCYSWEVRVCACECACMCACVYVYVYVYVRSFKINSVMSWLKPRKHHGLLRINKHGLSKQDFALNMRFINQPCLESRLNKNSLKNNL